MNYRLAPILLSVLFAMNSLAASVGIRFAPISAVATKQTEPMQDAGSNIVFNVEKATIIDQTNVVKAEVTQLEGKPAISVLLTPQGAAKLNQYSKKNIGNKLGIIVGDKVVSAPKIKDPITGDHFVLSGMSSVEVKDIADQINQKK